MMPDCGATRHYHYCHSVAMRLKKGILDMQRKKFLDTVTLGS
jgi:hypothetical protein